MPKELSDKQLSLKIPPSIFVALTQEAEANHWTINRTITILLGKALEISKTKTKFGGWTFDFNWDPMITPNLNRIHWRKYLGSHKKRRVSE